MTNKQTHKHNWTEIAREMNIDESTVRCYYNRGLKKALRWWVKKLRKDKYLDLFDRTDMEKFNDLRGKL